MLLIQHLTAIPPIWWDIQLWGLGRGSPDSSAFPTWQGGVFFQGCVPPDDTVNSKSVVGVTPGDSGVVIAYQVNEFTHIWSVECFTD